MTIQTKKFAILKRIAEVLANVPNIQSIYTQIETPIDRSEVPAINISWSSDINDLFGSNTKCTRKLNISISIICRGEDWQQNADALSVDTHKILLESSIHDDIYQIIQKSSAPEQHMADTTCGLITHEYAISYYANTLDN